MPPKWPSIVDVLLFSPKGPAPILREDRIDVEGLQDQVQRSLENLLNTHRRCGQPFKHLAAVSASVYYYGIPDFTVAGFSSSESREKLRADICQAIRRFEPRLQDVTVEEFGDGSKPSRVLRFRIKARLNVYPRPQRVEYDSRLDCGFCIFTVDRL